MAPALDFFMVVAQYLREVCLRDSISSLYKRTFSGKGLGGPDDTVQTGPKHDACLHGCMALFLSIDVNFTRR